MKLSNRVTTQLVKNAITELERQGMNPTFNLIRDQVGYLSNSTILEIWTILKLHHAIPVGSAINTDHKTGTKRSITSR